MRIASGLLVWALLAWSSTTVRAQTPEVYVVAVAREAGAQAAASEVSALARAALAEAEGFRFREADAVLHGELTAAHDAYAEALTQLGRGRQAYLALELDAAQRALEAATDQFQKAGPVLDSPEPFSQALMYLGATHVLAGNATAARAVFERYHAAFGELSPDARVFNPEVMAAWTQAGKTLSARAKGAIALEGAAATAEITLDGRVRARGASTLDGLAPGEHALRVAVLGAAPFFTTVTLKPRERARVTVPAMSERAELSARLHGGMSSAERDGLRELLAVDALAVVELAQAGSDELTLTLSVSGLATSRPSKSEHAGADFLARDQAVRMLVAEFLDRVAERAHAVERGAEVARAAVAAPAPATPPRDEAPRAWYRKPWFWTVVGVVVLGGAAAGTAVALSQQKKRTPGQGGSGGTLTLEF
jgi:hypothetical protein